jgi:phosphatidate cytidylyltransferase
MFAAAVALVGALALEEFCALMAGGSIERPDRWLLPFGAVVTFSFILGPMWTVGTLVAAVVALLITAIPAAPSRSVLTHLGAGALGLLYTSLLLGFVSLLDRSAVLVLLGIVWGGDAGAYYGGLAFGRRQLARVSPNKTVEGALVGGAASILIGSLLGGEILGMSYSRMAAVAALTAVAAQVGDLCESALKRGANVKDSGTRLPGHGGFLDRIDSLLFAAPAFYWLLRI